MKPERNLPKYEEQEKNIRAAEADEDIASLTQGACRLLNASSYMKRRDADGGIEVDMRSDDGNGDEVGVVESREASAAADEHFESGLITEVAAEDGNILVEVDEGTSTAVERLNRSFDLQIPSERMKRAISSLRIAYTTNLDQASAAGDVMAVDSYRKAVKELDDAFLAVHSGASNYATLPPFPAPYRSTAEMFIPCNLHLSPFPSGCSWRPCLHYQHIPQSRMPFAYMPQFYVPPTYVMPTVYNPYISRTGQRPSLHQRTSLPRSYPRDFVMPRKMTSSLAAVGQSKTVCNTAPCDYRFALFHKSQSAPTVTNCVKCVEELEEIVKRRPSINATREAEVSLAEAETNDSETKSPQSKAPSSVVEKKIGDCCKWGKLGWISSF